MADDEDSLSWDVDGNELFDMNSFTLLLRAEPPIAPVPAEEHQPNPVACVNYTPEFRHVAEHLRGVIASAEASPRVMVALAMGLKYAPANYNVWKRRRDIVLNAVLFERACVFGLGLSPAQWRPQVLPPRKEELILLTDRDKAARWRTYEDALARRSPYTFPEYLDGKLLMYQSVESEPRFGELTAQEKLCAAWAPNGDFILPPAATDAPLMTYEELVVPTTGTVAESSASMCGRRTTTETDPPTARVFDVWHAVAWELRITRYSAVTIGKSFQTWNHRKELIMSAACQTADTLRRTEAVADFTSHGSCYATHAHAQPPSTDDGVAAHATKRGLTFADFDERGLTSYVLRFEDGKNYHAFSHRAWFVMFTGLLDTVDGCNVELDFTQRLIEEDPFNNSAWSHRLLVIRHGIVQGTQPTESVTSQDEIPLDALRDKRVVAFPWYFPRRWALDPRSIEPFVPSKRPRCFDISDNMAALLNDEVEFALAMTLHDPRNEAPFTYAVGLTQLIADAARDQNLAAAFASSLTTALRGVDTSRFVRTRGPAPVTADDDEGIDMSGYANGSTEHLRCTHVDVHRAAALFHALALYSQLDAEDAARKEEIARERRELATRLAEIDPIRRKYWRAEAQRC
jgi:hypothetical protein